MKQLHEQYGKAKVGDYYSYHVKDEMVAIIEFERMDNVRCVWLNKKIEKGIDSFWTLNQSYIPFDISYSQFDDTYPIDIRKMSEKEALVHLL